MKKLLTAFVIYLLGFSVSYSQDGKDRGLISISGGLSLPVGDFARKELQSNSSGIAKTGQSLNISYSRLLGRSFGFSVELLGQRNPLDVNSMQTSLSKTKISSGFWSTSKPNQQPPPGSYSTYPNWKLDKKSWLYGSLLAGGYGEFGSAGTGHVSFIAKALIGAIYAASPEMNGNSVTDTVVAHIEQTTGYASGFAYLVGGGIKFNVSEKICLLTNLEYFGTSKLKFKDIRGRFTAAKGSPGTPAYSFQEVITTGNGNQVISTLNFNVGIGLRL